MGVNSRAGEGSTFWFTARLRMIDGEMPGISKLIKAVGINLPMPRTILVAEDNRVNQKVVKALLEKRGHTVTVAETGVDALALTGQKDFDVILMDVQMPKMDGITAMRLLRERGSQIPVIVVTAHAMLGDRERFLSAGADGYISKPIQIEQLQAEIDAVLNAASCLS